MQFFYFKLCPDSLFSNIFEGVFLDNLRIFIDRESLGVPFLLISSGT